MIKVASLSLKTVVTIKLKQESKLGILFQKLSVKSHVNTDRTFGNQFFLLIHKEFYN